MGEKGFKNNNLLYGLVLAGGKSQRMGHDKGLINWHGKEQRYYLADLLGNFCKDVYISCRKDQEKEVLPHYKTIVDSYENLGQYGAILSAMTKFTDRSWLVVACDLPLIYGKDIELLLSKRDSKKLATAFISPFDNLPEPLIAIWEAKSYERLMELLKEGISCPRKALIKIEPNVKLIKTLFSNSTMNVNTVQDAEKARKLIFKRQTLEL